MWNNIRLIGCTVRLLHDDTVSKSPGFEMDLLNFLDLRCRALKGGKGGSLFRATYLEHVIIFKIGRNTY